MITRISLRFTADMSEELLAAIAAFQEVLRQLGVTEVEMHVGGCPECGGESKASGIPNWQNRRTCVACSYQFSV